MRWVERFRMAMLMLFRRKAESERLNRELEFHLEQQIAENIDRGMEPEEARLAALRLFGNPTLLREEARTSWSWNWLESAWRDLRLRSADFIANSRVLADRHTCNGAGHWSDYIAFYDCSLGLA